jgi:hypothetical protein
MDIKKVQGHCFSIQVQVLKDLAPLVQFITNTDNLVYGDETQEFTFGGSSDLYNPNDIIVINVDRARYKQRLRPTSLNLTLGSGSKSITLLAVDNNLAVANDNPSVTNTESGRQFNIVSGSTTAISGSNFSSNT